MILPIHIEPSPILHQKAEPIAEITPDIRRLASDMRETMLNARGMGLAAPQVGQGIQLIVLELVDADYPEESIPYMALVNPRITWHGTRKVPFNEACLSIPGVEGNVHRPDRVRVKARDLDGNEVEIQADGLLARILQHEIDHLNGILFTSYVPKKQLTVHDAAEYPKAND